MSLGFEILLPMVKYFPIVSSLLHCISCSCHKISSTDVCTFSNKEKLNVIWIWYMGISHEGLFSIVDIFKKWYKSFLFFPKRVTSSICSSYPIPFLRIGASLLISYFSLSPIQRGSSIVRPLMALKIFRKKGGYGWFIFSRSYSRITTSCLQNYSPYRKLVAKFLLSIVWIVYCQMILNNLIKKFNGLFLNAICKP